MVNTGGGGGSVAKNGTFVTSVVSIRNNANHADNKNKNTGLLSLNRTVVSWQEITHAVHPAYMYTVFTNHILSNGQGTSPP